jgi:hypothetical protein
MKMVENRGLQRDIHWYNTILLGYTNSNVILKRSSSEYDSSRVSELWERSYVQNGPGDGDHRPDAEGGHRAEHALVQYCAAGCLLPAQL